MTDSKIHRGKETKKKSKAKQTMNYKHYRENWRLSNTNHTTQSMMNSYAPEGLGLAVPAPLTEECLKYLRYTIFLLRFIICVFYTIVLIKADTRIRLSYKYLNHYALNDIISTSLDLCFQQRKCFIMFKMETVCCGMITFVKEAHFVTPLATHRVMYVKR
jgi:hypothetical protein